MRFLVFNSSVFAFAACSQQPTTTASEKPFAHHFDEIITRKWMEVSLTTTQAFEFTQRKEPERSTYRFDWKLHDPTDPTIHANVEITVAPGGAFLSEEEYAQFRRAMANHGLLDDVPFSATIARLAWSAGVGPNGGGETFVATTGDHKYDIRISQSNHLTGGCPFQPPRLELLAANILQSYSEMANEADEGKGEFHP